MKCLLLVTLTLALLITISNAKKKKYEGDFEFVDEDDKSFVQKPIPERKKWIHDPSSDLCRPLNCKKRELCLLEDAYTAVCVSKKQLYKNRDEVITKSKSPEDEQKHKTNNAEPDTNADNKDVNSNSNGNVKPGLDDDVFYDSDGVQQDDDCKPCPVVKPTFLCGNDNRTYSSLCRLDYHNCIHSTAIKVACKGFCPCKSSSDNKQQRMADRQKYFQAKYKATMENEADHDKDLKNDKHKVRGYNEVLDKFNTKYTKSSANSRFPTKSSECKPQQLTAIGNRLLDWFSVIMADSKKRRQRSQKSKAHFPAACKTEAKWMFGHMDLNNDGLLSTQELYDLEHDQNERCIKPFIDTCDLDQDNTINPREWCRCFEKTDRPCAAVRRRIGVDFLGAYAPDCDLQGFYKPTQCHNSVGVCWCVDKHGVEFANTRTRGKPNCDDVINKATAITSDDEDDDNDEEDSSEGSADNLLVF